MITASDITTDHAAYAARRGGVRARIIPLRRLRRIDLGDLVGLEFENAATLTYQAQEMVYTERLSDPAAVAGEIDSYARLLPSSHRLVATLFIELDDLTTVRSVLRRLTGIQRQVSLVVGGEQVAGEEIPGPDEDPARGASATVSVHMLAFPLTDAQRDAIRDPTVAMSAMINHPEYSADAPITAQTRLSLIADLTLA